MRPCFFFLSLFAFTSCQHTTSWRSEEFPDYQTHRSTEVLEEKLDQKKIVLWSVNPRDRKRIGWFEEWRVKPRGTREWRTVYRIYEVRGVDMIGFLSQDGAVFKFDRAGRAERLGEFKVLTTGIKVILGLDLSAQVEFEEIDPYGE